MSTALPENREWPAVNGRRQMVAEADCVEYEQTLARLIGVNQAVAFGYARHALISILDAAGLTPGDEVILAPLTCKVVPLALLSLKLKPVYADIAAETLNLDARAVESAISPATRAILFQHTYGHPAGIESVARIAARKNLLLVEDCAQCLPYAADGYRPGSWGQAAIFSANLLKPLPAGSGGVAVTNDHSLAAAVRARRDRLPQRGRFAEAMFFVESRIHRYVLSPRLYWPLFEINRAFGSSYRARPLADEIASEIISQAYRINASQSRAGLRWLAKLDDIAAHRRANCAGYARALREVAGLTLPCVNISEPLYYFPALVERKRELLRLARRRLLEVIPWPLQTPIYPIEREADLANYDYRLGSCSVAEETARSLIGLPTSPMNAGQRDAVAALLKDHHAKTGGVRNQC